MRLKTIYIKEGLFNREIIFSENANLIFSKHNSCGKTTLIRFILYSLGYQVPNTRKIKFENCDVKCTIELEDKKNITLHRTNGFSISIVETNESFALPEQQDNLHAVIFGTESKDILHNILGAFYFDQEKGWTLLNRGVVIGSIHFNIDELIRGISGCDCSRLLDKEHQIDANLSKYRQMFSIAQYRESLTQGELVVDSYQDEVDIEIQKLIMKKNSIERDIRRVGQSICGNRRFMEFVDDMKLLVMTEDGQQITVTKDNVVGLNDSVELLIAKKKMLMKELSEVLRKIEQLSSQKKRRNNNFLFLNQNL